MRRLLWVMLAVSLVTTACSGGDDDDDGGTPATVSGTVRGSDGDTDILLVGATVEEVGTSNSAVTASGGVFTITVDAGEPVFLRADAAGYYPSQGGVIAPVAGATDFQINLPSDAQVAGVSGALGVTLDPAKGILGVDFAGAFTTTQGGFTVTLSAATDGAFTFDSAGNPVLSSLYAILDVHEALHLT